MLEGEDSLWSPVEDRQTGCGPGDDQKTLANIFRENQMSPDEKTLFRFLYSSRERKEALVEGFYGHPSIGAALIAKNLDFSGEPWRSLVGAIERDVKNGETRVFLVASVFGGTGAAGFPTIARQLRETIRSDNLKLGGLLLLPYFKFTPPGEENQDRLYPDSGNFLAKAKTAMYYYDNQQYSEIFDRLYLLGDSYQEFGQVTPSRGKRSQNNKPHIIEMYGALAVADFFRRMLSGRGSGISLITRSKTGAQTAEPEGNYVYDWQALSQAATEMDVVKIKLSQFLRFALVYTKTYHPVIERIAADRHRNRVLCSSAWYKHYFLDRNRDIQSTGDAELTSRFRPLRDYCRLYIDWLYHLHQKETGAGTPVIDSRIRLFNMNNPALFTDVPAARIRMANFADLVDDRASQGNQSTAIYHDICLPPQRSAAAGGDGFIHALYKYAKLK